MGYNTVTWNVFSLFYAFLTYEKTATLDGIAVFSFYADGSTDGFNFISVKRILYEKFCGFNPQFR